MRDVALVAASLIAIVLIRLPLILNARAALDSDLAVDGLTVLGAARGHWRWHYPGTPHVGTASLAAILPVALLFGPTPEALAIGGTILYALAVVAAYAMARRVFGPGLAAWSLLPWAFASTGTIWLAGRITGGHLLAVAFHAGSFLLLFDLLRRGGPVRGLGLGVWLGLGLWSDSMATLSMAGLVPAGVLAWFRSGRSRGGIAAAGAVGLGLAIGLVPKAVGSAVDPHDAYGEQFAIVTDRAVLLDHAKTLLADCLPRLVAGHRIPGLQADPGGFAADGQAGPGRPQVGALPVALLAIVGSLGLGGLALGSWRSGDDPGAARSAVALGLAISSAAVVAAFVVNRNIYNSDNYRYLVLLLVPWSLLVGRALLGLGRLGTGGRIAAGLVGLLFAVGFTVDAIDWYRRLGWVDSRGWPVRVVAPDPVLGWLDSHPEVTNLYGGYWDVYRLSFLTGGRVVGVPSGHYPDRFPGSASNLPGGHPGHALIRPTPVGVEIRRGVARAGGAVAFQTADALILAWP